MTTEQRETMISQIMDITPTSLALNAVEILDGTGDKGLVNIHRQVSDSHGQSVWVGLLESIAA